MTLGEQLHGARVVRYDENTELTIAWFGGHGIHGYTAEGKEILFWNVGDFARDNADMGLVIADIEEHILRGDYLEFC